jgi:alpha-ketoglutarate-dependent taurine dioxygenase
MSYKSLRVEPATPKIGAFGSGVNITGSLSNHEVSALQQALADHQVVFFRDEPFTLEGHKAFGRLFGQLHIHPNTPGPDSVAFWDNRAVQHKALWDYFPNVRSGYRVTVKGDRPFQE